jgi:hypothetical protein
LKFGLRGTRHVESHTLRLLQEMRTEMAGLRDDFARFDQRSDGGCHTGSSGTATVSSVDM